MTVTTTDDHVRAEVERRLRLIVDGALALPRGAQRRVDACVRRRLDTARELIGAPLAMMRSLFDLVATPAEPMVPTADVAPVVTTSSGGGNDRAASAAAAGDLPIDEYESLAASQVVARLDGLSPAELRRVREFEVAHRGRRTVLGKVDQLLDAVIDPVVRPARPADAAALRLLEDEARAGLVGARGGARWLEEHPTIGSDWESVMEDRDVFVAELDGAVVVGYLVLELVGDVAVVDQVYVTGAARELGFGDALLETATDRARQRGARLIEGQALPGDRDTKNLYERARITARLITVSRPLNAPSTGADASR